MRLNPQEYQVFLSLPLEQYCQQRVETVRTEIWRSGAFRASSLERGTTVISNGKAVIR